MPYTIVHSGEEWCVHKMNADDTPGETVKCHPSEQEAKDHTAALDMAMERMGERAVKAAGEYELDILAVPFDTQDSDRQHFDANTDIMPEQFQTPAVIYQHSIKQGAKGWEAKPVIVGKTVPGSLKKESDGWHIRVILDKAAEFARGIMDAAKRGLVAVSSGTVDHLARLDVGGKLQPYSKGTPGRIAVWPLAEVSIWEMGNGNLQPANRTAYALPALKAIFDEAGIALPEIVEYPANGQAAGQAAAPGAAANNQIPKGDIEMDEKDVDVKVQAAVKAALDKAAADTKAEADKQAAIQAEAEKIANAKIEAYKAEAAKSRRLPDVPFVTKYADTNKFDGLTAGETAVMLGVLQSRGIQPSEAAFKALAVKLAEDKGETGEIGRRAMKAAGLDAAKANELDYSTLSNYGDEWVGIGYSQSIWEAIRVGTFVVNKLPQIEVPQGQESIYLPLESTDPTWYTVSESTTSATGYAGPTPTVTASTLGTARVQLTLAKLGARVVWTGELDEGSLIPFAPQLRTQLGKSGAEYLESAVIDGDTETSSSTNINNIGGAIVTGGHYLAFNGLRKSPLVTTTANSRSAAGGLTIEDYLETVKLMGGAGINALDKNAVSFIIDPNTYFATCALPEVKTRDSFSSPTIEGGELRGLWGYGINVSGSMHKMSAVRKANSAGKVNTTDTTANLYGAILAVRWDQWKFGWRRRMTMETTRWAASDTNEIVAMVRCGLIQRDTEASAISYYVGV